MAERKEKMLESPREPRIPRTHSTMTVSAEIFDRLSVVLDQPAALALSLERAFVEPRFMNR